MTQAFQILVLDDERYAADLLATLLGSHLPDAVVRVVYTGEDAVTVASEHRPDVAVLDLEMGGLDGEGAARALRSTYPDSRLVLVALSGNVLRLGTLRMTGTFDYLLSKPVDLAALIEVLKKHIHQD